MLAALLGRQFPQKQRPLHLDTRLLCRLRSGQRPPTFGIDRHQRLQGRYRQHHELRPRTIAECGRSLCDQSEIPHSERFESTHFQRRHHGGKAIEIVPGSSPELLQPGDTLYSEINKGFLETAGSEFEFIKQRANDVISRLTVTLDNLNAILADNRAGLNTTVNNMASITGNINDLMVSEKGSLRNIIANLNSLSQTLKSKEGQIGHILTNVDKFTDSLSKSQFPTAIAEMTVTLNRLNTTVDKVNNGEGR